MINGRKKNRSRLGECLERRDLLTVAFEMGPSASWREQLAVFQDDSLVEVAAECDGTCESLTLVQTYDGIGNNADQPTWGATHQPLRRETQYAYADGISAPAGADRPNPRTISNAIATQRESALSANGLSNLVWVWGQFIDHDITLTPANPNEPFDVPIPAGDEMFDPEGTGTVTMSLNRSAAFEGTGTSVDNPRQQFNEITAFLDGSAVYGSDVVRANALRLFSGGRLKTSDTDNLLPANVDGLPNEGGTGPNMFLAGDVRANENVALTAMHTIWVREHNRIADSLAARNPDWNDEQIYQYARAIVTAEIQAITYNEFLPALLGPRAISMYKGYDPETNPTITSVFAGATYRLGHSMLPEEMMRMDTNHHEMPEGPMPLRDAFFAPYAVTSDLIDTILQGAAHQLARHIDNQIVDDVRNFMFGQPGAGGFDLATLNIQRGRDQGLASYNQVRRDLGLVPANDFSDISSDPHVAQVLSDVYDSVEDVDAWVGALAEDHVRGAAVGELIHVSLVNQFESIRNGDRFWYENRFDGMLRQYLRRTTLKSVIERNTNAANLQRNVFFATQMLPVPGDVNGDWNVNFADLEALAAGLEADSDDPIYDVNEDGLVDGQDSVKLATEYLGLLPGDANGDGVFNRRDVMQIFGSGEYEDGIPENSTWLEGDFNGDREFDSQDMRLALWVGNFRGRVMMARPSELVNAANRFAPAKADLVSAIDVVFGETESRQRKSAAVVV